MAITVNLRYTGKDGAARKFAEEMTASGTVAAIRAEAGNLRYEYYQPLDDPETVLLIDSWENQAAIDAHHASPMMKTIVDLSLGRSIHNGHSPSPRGSCQPFRFFPFPLQIYGHCRFFQYRINER